MRGRLTARPVAPSEVPFGVPGLRRLGLRPDRDTVLYVPSSYDPTRPAPLVVSLHGAGGDASAGLALLRPAAEGAGLLVVAPSSERATWDVITGGFGPDVAAIDLVLRVTFARYAVDPARISVAGFSDGASYALSLGMTNGDLFPRIAAFSPGFMAPSRAVGRPQIWISHGRGDSVLPIDATSRRIVPRLRDQGYDVLYREFDGPHTVPAEVAAAAVDWMTSRRCLAGRGLPGRRPGPGVGRLNPSRPAAIGRP